MTLTNIVLLFLIVSVSLANSEVFTAGRFKRADPLYKASLFENTYFQGAQLDLSASDTQCRDIPANFLQHVSSIHGRDGCILVFSEKGCEGQRRIIKSGCNEADCCYSHGDMSSCSFDNKATSYAFCNSSAIPPPPPTYKASLFENTYFQGAQLDLSASDTKCHDIPANFLQKTSSIHGRDGCILVFSESGCGGQRKIIKSNCNEADCCGNHGDMNSCSFDNKAASYAFCNSNAIPTPAPLPPPSIFDCHNITLYRDFYNADIAIYYDATQTTKPTYLNDFITKAWKYTKQNYGSFGGSDILYVMIHNEWWGGHPHTTYDSKSNYRNEIDMGYFGNDVNQQKDMTLHEIAHIVEFYHKGFDRSPAFPNIWGDSMWAQIFQYDVYAALGMSADQQRNGNAFLNSSATFPRNGTFWFKNWWYPIWSNNGNSNNGGYTLNRYFDLLTWYFPTYNVTSPRGTYPAYTRDINMGEFIHFWCGAANRNLKALAAFAFGWPAQYETQFQQAQKDFPNVKYI